MSGEQISPAWSVQKNRWMAHIIRLAENSRLLW